MNICKAGHSGHEVLRHAMSLAVILKEWRIYPSMEFSHEKETLFSASRCSLCNTLFFPEGASSTEVMIHSVTVFYLIIGPAVRADFRRLYSTNAKMPTCCPSDDNRTKVTNSVTSARSLWWHVGPYFWPADLTRTANPIAPVFPWSKKHHHTIKTSLPL